MKKKLLIIGIAILLTVTILTGCFGNEDSSEKKKFVGTWESATLLNEKLTTFYLNGTGFDESGSFEWDIKDGQLTMFWPERKNTVTYDYEFINTDEGERLILTDVLTGKPDDYKRT